MKALREGQGVDVLTVCCRWYGGEMIGVSLAQPHNWSNVIFGYC